MAAGSRSPTQDLPSVQRTRMASRLGVRLLGGLPNGSLMTPEWVEWRAAARLWRVVFSSTYPALPRARQPLPC